MNFVRKVYILFLTFIVAIGYNTRFQIFWSFTIVYLGFGHLWIKYSIKNAKNQKKIKNKKKKQKKSKS